MKSYSQTPSKAAETRLTTTDYQQQSLSFFWYIAHNNASIPEVTNLAATFPTNWNGFGRVSVQANFSVWSPTVTLSAPTLGSVNVQDLPPNCVISLGFGFADPAGPCGGTPPGISWNFSATSPANAVGGQLDATQLIDIGNSDTPMSGFSSPPTPYPNTSGTYDLDTCLRYGNKQGQHTALAGGSSALWNSDDSPSFPLQTGWHSFSATDRFRIYAVFMPDNLPSTPSQNSNIWVALGLMQWKWSGVATFPTPSPSGKPTPNPIWRKSSGAGSVTSVANTPQPLPVWNALAPTAPQPCPPGG